MLLSEVRVSAFTPSAHKIIIQHPADQRTRNRNNPASPLFDKFSARFGGDFLDNLRYQAIHQVFFQQVTTKIYSGRARSGDPELHHFIFCVEFIAVDQAELLDHPYGYSSKNAEVGHDGEEAANTKTCALRGGKLHPAVNDFFGSFIENRYVERIHSLKTGDRQPMCSAEFKKKAIRIDTD